MDAIVVAKTKVVINRKFGGFGLSQDAWTRLKELGCEYGPETEYEMPRHHPLLVQVVEELGAKANGPCARLKVVEIELSYEVSDYDGKETVEVNGNLWDGDNWR
jgi:hypothetical protein